MIKERARNLDPVLSFVVHTENCLKATVVLVAKTRAGVVHYRHTKCMRLLLVEDERRMAALLEQGFTEEGIHVFPVYDGEDGLAAAQSSSFDAIILDVQLPSLDGLTVARRIRKSGNQTPILMLTARDTE